MKEKKKHESYTREKVDALEEDGEMMLSEEKEP